MISVVPVNCTKLVKKFIDVPYALYRDDPHWVPPLRIERREFLNPRKNPFFDHAKAQLFLALQDGRPVGRISAHVNRLHNERYGEKTGHFGLFEAVPDPAVAQALIDCAEQWLAAEGMKRAVGPLSFTINEEVGLLIEGFDSPPYPFMPHNPPYYTGLITQAGYRKSKDLIAWDYDTTRPVPAAALQIAAAVRTQPNLTVREIDMQQMEREVRIISDVFNSAWAGNWGFIPWTESEIQKMAKDFKLIIEPKLALIAEVGGVPAAISMAIPNYHEVIKDLNGQLFPFGLFKLIFRLKWRRVKSARLCLLGIKKEFRHDVLAGLSVLLYTEMHRRSQERGHRRGELSWTLEDNDKINHGIALMGGRPYKKYRIFEKDLNHLT
jgi:hypothetical protein